TLRNDEKAIKTAKNAANIIDIKDRICDNRRHENGRPMSDEARTWAMRAARYLAEYNAAKAAKAGPAELRMWGQLASEAAREARAAERAGRPREVQLQPVGIGRPRPSGRRSARGRTRANAVSGSQTERPRKR